MTAEELKSDLLSAYAAEVKAGEKRNKLLRASEEEKAVSALNERLKAAALNYRRSVEAAEADKEREKASAALYSELRGDRGGIGKLEYLSAYQNAAAAKRDAGAALSSERSTVLNEIAEKRNERALNDALGEEKAASSIAAKNAELGKWAYEREQAEKSDAAALALKEAALLGEYKGEKTADVENKENSAEKKTLSSACYALLERGVMPSEEQLTAAGITKQQAESFIAALLSAGKIKSPMPAPSSPTGGETLILSSPGTGGKSLGAY